MKATTWCYARAEGASVSAYLLTAAGRDLFPVLAALREWGERHVTPLRHAPAETDL